MKWNQLLGVAAVALVSLVDARLIVAEGDEEAVSGIDSVAIEGKETSPGSCEYEVSADADFSASLGVNFAGSHWDFRAILLIASETESTHFSVHGPDVFSLSPGQSSTWALSAEHTGGARDYWAHARVYEGVDPHFDETGSQSESVYLECAECGCGE